MKDKLQEITERIYSEVVTHESPFGYKREYIQAELKPLLQQIEKQQQEIQGLEEQAGEMAEKHAEKDNIMGNMQQEIERYEEALRFYSRKLNYSASTVDQDIPIVNKDNGQTARKALGNKR